MKTILFAAVLAAFSFTACEKNTIDQPNPTQEEVTSNLLTPPESVVQWISSNYPDYTIGKTTTTQSLTDTFYSVTISRATLEADRKLLVFNANGELLSIQHL
jgi:hypothetical protein